MIDRTNTAEYYDLAPKPIDDVPFYLRRLPSPTARVLELGCGTGRVLVPLAAQCGVIQGLDCSEPMLARCRAALERAEIPAERASVAAADITNFDLGQQFDLIIAPFRVLQNLETDAEVDGLFECLHRHLAPGGTCILNVFMPNCPDPDTLRREWISLEEHLEWELPFQEGHVTCHNIRPRLDAAKLILYPELIYRYYQDDALRDEVRLKLVMRCYYPQQFEELVTGHGFTILTRWGGYQGEVYGEGPELVLQFQQAAG